MPIYDYVCSNCRQLTEVIHGIDAPGPRFCPACGAEGTLRKTFAATAVHFKGSGWAKKDRSSSKRAAARKSGDADSAAAKDGKSSDTGSTGKDSSGDAGSTSKPAQSGSSESSKAEA